MWVILRFKLISTFPLCHLYPRIRCCFKIGPAAHVQSFVFMASSVLSLPNAVLNDHQKNLSFQERILGIHSSESHFALCLFQTRASMNRSLGRGGQRSKWQIDELFLHTPLTQPSDFVVVFCNGHLIECMTSPYYFTVYFSSTICNMQNRSKARF